VNKLKCLILLIRYHYDGLFNTQADLRDYNYNIPIGLAYISSFLKRYGHDVHFLNLNHLEGTAEDLLKTRLSKEFFDFVLSGSISIFYPDIKNCVNVVRKYSPKTKIILGGGLISSQPEVMFGLLQPDFGVVGEGEQTIKELFDCLEHKGDIASVDGLIYRDSDGQIRITKPRVPLTNLDILPWPDYEGLNFSEYLDNMLPSHMDTYSIFDNPRAYPIIASRSCPYACTFCFHPLGKKYRKRSIDNIIDEIDYALKKYKINIIFFYDELFANDRLRTFDFCKKLTDLLKKYPWDVKWFCQMRVDVLDEELITIMKNSGCFSISLGLESYSVIVLKSMKKFISPKQINDAIHLIHKHQLGFTGNFIFGDPAETNETYHETLTYWKENQSVIKNQIDLGRITLYQGSPLYKRALERGIVKGEIEFIEEREKNGTVPINFTDKMTDAEYNKMLQEIAEANIIIPRYSVPIRSITVNGIPEVHVKCPHCNNISVYRNVSLPPFLGFQSADRRLYLLICRNCHARIKLITKHEYFTIILYRIFGFKIGASIIRYVMMPPVSLLRIINKYIHKKLIVSIMEKAR